VAASVLRAFPRREGRYHLFVDGSLGDAKDAGGLGGHLMQEDDKGALHTIAFTSRQLQKHEQNYSAFLLELQAAVHAIDYFSHYLRGRHFLLYTDHAPLQKLSSIHTKTLHRLHALLNEHSFEMRHIPGKRNPVADFLSRSHGPSNGPTEESPAAPIDTRPSRLAEAQAECPVLGPIHRALLRGQDPPLPPSLQRYAGRIALKEGIVTIQLPPRPGVITDAHPRALIPAPLRRALLQEAHDSALGGHQGIYRTAERIREQFWWPGMQQDVDKHVRDCVICQATSNKGTHPPLPAEEFPQPQQPNERVHVDLFGPIEDRKKQKVYILGCTDAFTKVLRLCKIPNKSACTVAKALWKHWMAIYGVPQTLISDQGAEFTNQLQQAVFETLGIDHRTTTPYWPQCNTQQEKQNKVLAQYLRAILYAAQRSSLDWELYLPALQLSVNTAVNKAIRMAPFRAMFGYDPRLPLWHALEDVLKKADYELPPADKDAFYAWQETRREAQRTAHNNERRYRDARFALDHDRPITTTFTAGQPVWLKCHVVTAPNRKFTKFFEPAVIISREGPNTYKVRRLEAQRRKILTVNAAHLKARSLDNNQPPDADTDDEEEEDVGDDEDTGDIQPPPRDDTANDADADDDEGSADDQHEEEENNEDPNYPPPRPTRTRRPPARYGDGIAALHPEKFDLEDYLHQNPDLNTHEIRALLAFAAQHPPTQRKWMPLLWKHVPGLYGNAPTPAPPTKPPTPPPAPPPAQQPPVTPAQPPGPTPSTPPRTPTKQQPSSLSRQPSKIISKLKRKILPPKTKPSANAQQAPAATPAPQAHPPQQAQATSAPTSAPTPQAKPTSTEAPPTLPSQPWPAHHLRTRHPSGTPDNPWRIAPPPYLRPPDPQNPLTGDYDELFTNARSAYLTAVEDRTPALAIKTDGGARWMSLHDSIFHEVNAHPSKINPTTTRADPPPTDLPPIAPKDLAEHHAGWGHLPRLTSMQQVREHIRTIIPLR